MTNALSDDPIPARRTLLLAGGLALLLGRADSGHAGDEPPSASATATAWPRASAASDATAPLSLRIESSDTQGELRGLVHAVSEHAFAAVAKACASPDAWCEILMLHLNTKACTLQGTGADRGLTLWIARKHDQSVRNAFQLPLKWSLVQSSPHSLEVHLEGAQGPFGSTDYLIQLRATAASSRSTALELAYSCRFAAAARLAMQTYLATVASNKVGFSSADPARPERLVGGLRGVVERTAMRYYLAIEAWLDAARLAPEQQRRRRHELWFDATERYPRQLRELDRQTYLADKLDPRSLR